MDAIKVGTLAMVIRGPNSGKVGVVLSHSFRDNGSVDHLIEFPEPVPSYISGIPTGRESRRLWGRRTSLLPLPPLDDQKQFEADFFSAYTRTERLFREVGVAR